MSLVSPVTIGLDIALRLVLVNTTSSLDSDSRSLESSGDSKDTIINTSSFKLQNDGVVMYFMFATLQLANWSSFTERVQRSTFNVVTWRKHLASPLSAGIITGIYCTIQDPTLHLLDYLNSLPLTTPSIRQSHFIFKLLILVSSLLFQKNCIQTHIIYLCT